MNTEDKIKRFAVDPDKAASSKARKFLSILSGGGPIPKGMTYRELKRIVKTYSQEKVDEARTKFKAQKRASKYLRALCLELNASASCQVWTRGECEEYIESYKQSRPDVYKEARKKLRGFSYEQ
jgi:hypothetical protein